MRKLKESEVAKSFLYKDGRLYRIFKSKTKLMSSLTLNGYRRVRFKMNYYLEHRIIWAMFNGDVLDNMEVDHINGVKCDNRIGNLRLATRSQNNQNTKVRISNKTGLVGVYKNRAGDKYAACITKNGKSYRTKSYENKEDAFEEYKKMSVELFGEFSIYNNTL